MSTTQTGTGNGQAGAITLPPVKPESKPKKATAKARKPKKATARKPKKATAKARKPAKRAKRVNRGGGKALGDFANGDIVRVVAGKRKEIARGDCFRSGQTVAQCLAAQKKAGYRGRRKYVRKQIALGRITLKRK